MTAFEHMSYDQALAKPIAMTHENAPGFVACVQELAQKAGLKEPLQVELIPSMIPNAHFRHNGTGKTVCFSEGLFHLLENTDVHAVPNSEMQAVISHELSHARHALTERLMPAAMLFSLPLAGLGAMYLIDKTNEKLREHNAYSGKEEGQHPQSFWSAFQETLGDVQKQGVWDTLNEFSARSLPFTSKLFSSNGATVSSSLSKTGSGKARRDKYDDLYMDMPWGKALMEEAKYYAVAAAMTVPALAACHTLSLNHEFRADKFATALTGNKGMASALKKLESATVELVDGQAKTALQKNWAERIYNSIRQYFHEAREGAHPAISRRIDIIEKSDVSEAARYFGL